jgi:PAS domain S-box-containing protein
MKPARPLKSGLQIGLASAVKMVWAIVLGTALILLAVLFVVQQSISHERESAFANALDINSKTALSDEVRIRSLLASLDKVLLVLRKDFAENPKLTRQQLVRRMAELKVDSELNPNISYVDASGEVQVASASHSKNGKLKLNIADRAYFQAQKIEPADLLLVGAPVESRVTGKWVVPITRRILRKDGSFDGIISMTVDPSLFTEPFSQTSFGTQATRALIGLDGFTRLRLNGGKIAFGGDSRKSQLFNEIKRSKIGTYTAIASSDGVRRTVSYRVIDPYGIAIVAGFSVDSIEASYRNKVWGYTVASSLFGVLVLMLSGLLILGIVRQRKLFESQQNFNQLIELVPQMVSSLDMRRNITWVNLRMVDYVGPSKADQANGFDWFWAAVHPEDLQRMREHVAAATLQGPGAEPCEFRGRRHDGAYLWFSSQITRLLDQDGACLSFLQTSTDIHDRKMIEERTRVTQKLESIGQLTGGMAHDFNNLLAIIVGNLDLVKADVTVDLAAERLDVAISAALRGVGLVKSLLAVASRQPLRPVTIELWALIERIAPLLQHSAGPRVNFALHPPGVTAPVEVDEAGLEAVLLNLTVNAKDAMPSGGDLSLAVDVSGGMARIAIKDTGTGMPEAVLRRATEPFFTTKEQGRGTGLGLSMVAGFVKQSGGKLVIESEEGRGTLIAIYLPLVPASRNAKNPPPQYLAITATSPLVARTGKRKILIVDDEPALAQLVRTWARNAGHTAVLAGSADDALTLLAAKSFDVMLTDIMMPGSLDGIGLAERTSILYPEMKAILMSGYSKETATHRADIPWPLLVKPFRKDDFYAAVEQVLEPQRQ